MDIQLILILTGVICCYYLLNAESIMHINVFLFWQEVDWQTTRIEANAREDENSLPSTPLRLIANQSKIRIVLKKRLSGQYQNVLKNLLKWKCEGKHLAFYHLYKQAGT